MEAIGESEFYQRVVLRLKEREKELQCIYKVEEILRDSTRKLDDVFKEVLRVIPSGWQHPTLCETRIIFEGKVIRSDDFRETDWWLKADIVLDDNVAGRLDLVYTQKVSEEGKAVFLPEEQKLLNTIAESLSHHIFIRRLRATLKTLRSQPSPKLEKQAEKILSPDSDLHWKWRARQAELISHHMDMESFGVQAVYVIGSTKNATAGPESDIDLLIHFQGDAQQRLCLQAWLEAWSLSLAEISFLNTGHRPARGMLDVHLVTDEDIHKKTSFAVMIGATENGARLLKSRNTSH